MAAALTVTTLRLAPAAGAGPCDAPVANPIACENSKPGNPSSEWNIPTADAGDPDIQGYAAAISVDQGQTVQFKVKTPATDYRLDIYRLGYYGGLGARKIATVQPSAALPQIQPACLTNPSLGLVDCGNWALSASWAVPADAVSGVYIAKLVGEDGATGVSHIVFIVRDDDGHSPLLFKTSDPTWQAYNSYGGASLYRDFQFGLPAGRAFQVSYNRPFNTRSDIDGLGQRSFLFNAEYPMIRWLEANGYNVSYFTGVDTASRGAELLEHNVFLSVGHDEYWSGEERTNVETARNSGVDLAFFSGNEVFWKTRWENSIDGANTPYDTLVSYKETKANAKIDPSPLWTGTWRDPRFSPPSDGGRPENALTGTLFTVNGPRADTITVPAEYGNLRFWRNTNIASLAPGQVATLTSGSLGHEWDEDVDNGSRPAGLMGLSSTSVTLDSHLVDYGNTFTPGTARHSLTLYRHASGALVFGAGTVQWAWGLDANHDRGVSTPDARMQQATVNLFADMGVQAGSLQAGLVPATASSDATAPTSTITSPLAGATIASPVNVTGTATDSGGGVVAGVEVSVDGGATWHPATGRNNWSYSWAPSALGPTNIRSRAVDDSANIETPAAGINVNVTSATPICPCTIWPSSATPAVASHSSTQPWELGVKFKSDFDGYISGVRFYKGAANTGTHTGSLWTSAGALLASVTFTSETASGWQQALFSAPVAVTAGTTYVASYHTDTGGFAFNDAYFSISGFDRWPLHAPASDVAGGNGVFKSGASGFPNQSYNASNYWVDVVFNTQTVDAVAPVVTNRSPAAGATNISTLTNVAATFSEPVTPGSISFQLRDASNAFVPAVVTYDAATRTATLNPNATLMTPQTYTATVSGAADAAGNVMAPTSWSFSTPTCPCSIWPSSATPAVASVSDTQAWELGVKFKADLDGFITGIRFYKGAGNTGTHSGSLWSSTGTLLASATFVSETSSGWQEVAFSTPVNVTAGQTYVASYHTNNGGFSINEWYFASPPPQGSLLRALSDAESGGNGVYKPGAAGFPNQSYHASNYWVDVVFNTAAVDTTAPSVTNRSPAPGATKVDMFGPVTATFSEDVTPGSISFVLRDGSNAVVPSSVSYNAATRTATLTPSAPLALSSTFTATLSGASDPAGNTMSSVSWSFSTPACPCTIWDSSATPAIASVGDTNAWELGVKFRAQVNGYITGIRFYKGPGNTGTHTGSLWSSAGTQLATATFSGETSSGWQQVNFATPVAVTAGTTYVASYHTNNGGFSMNEFYFSAAGLLSSPLRALRDGEDGANGVYRFGASGFPDQTYHAANYWADVVFSTTP